MAPLLPQFASPLPGLSCWAGWERVAPRVLLLAQRERLARQEPIVLREPTVQRALLLARREGFARQVLVAPQEPMGQQAWFVRQKVSARQAPVASREPIAGQILWRGVECPGPVLGKPAPTT